ncbi:hypothetical protein RvY_10098-2 [Ramazzottius varieornatus]|uniref:Uncharacterized protein n=1 Tax=Ramazzottius varieornatus TaxID=947166 RepID=A0A1D1VG53_RAMVA|nr:hypothetical protein RvY_10098-2 [Ramazzottius varieornatus]
MAAGEPLIKTPLSDFSGPIFNMQAQHIDPLCRAVEMQLMKCIEAYGVPRFRRDCKDEYDDFSECSTKKKQKERYVVIQNERRRLFLSGQLKDRYMQNPELHSYPRERLA